METTRQRVRNSTCIGAGALLLALACITGPAQARLTRIHAKEPVLIDLPMFGATGPYLKITGTYEGEIDPGDRRNSVIADIKLAPSSNGKVHNAVHAYFVMKANSIA